ncbi:hypothetical protein IFM46972_11321 [Aspergillus udagawae]|uniref:Uncharacterized protein n=1 Tax=Aspergillus udagawae TaxID=91492 RepID=A0A8H3XR65_9EURO|nr:hypothetical protein IFM46972_11321 [Aspergillus udagawae]
MTSRSSRSSNSGTPGDDVPLLRVLGAIAVAKEKQGPAELNHLKNNGTEDRYDTGYIRAVRQYALNAQRSDAMGMAKVLEALTKINADTERLNQRMTTIEASTSTLSRSLSSVPVDSALAWRSFRARDWQRGLVFLDLIASSRPLAIV